VSKKWLNTWQKEIDSETDDFLLKYTDVRALPKVPERYHQSVQTWVYDNGPLNKGEETFLELRDDFATARRTPETKNLIEDFVEKCATKKPDSWLNVCPV
jgi:hypothetical protein